MNPLLEYLNQIRPYINAVAINELAGSENLLGKHYHYIDTNGEKGQLLSPKRYFDVLSALIKAFGVVNIGAFIYYDSSSAYVFACTTIDFEGVGDHPGHQRELVRYSCWDKNELIEHFTGTQELTETANGLKNTL